MPAAAPPLSLTEQGDNVGVCAVQSACYAASVVSLGWRTRITSGKRRVPAVAVMHGGHMPQHAVVVEETSNQRAKSGIMRTSRARTMS